MTPNTPPTGEEAGAIAVAREFFGIDPEAATSPLVKKYVQALAALITREKNAAIEQERERCAKICKQSALSDEDYAKRYPDEDGKRALQRAHRAHTLEAAIRATSTQAGKENK